MTNRQRIELAQVETRGTINRLAALEELEAEQRAELDTARNRYTDLDSQLAAEITIGDPPAPDTPEGTELRSMVDRATVGAFMQAAVEHRALSGVEAELQQHYGLNGAAMPLEMLEQRAIATVQAGATGNAATNFEAPPQQIVGRIFPASVLAYLGVSTPTVAAGQQNYPVIHTGSEANVPAANAASAESTAAVRIFTVEPRRLQASLRFNVEQRALLPAISDAFTNDLRAELMSDLDNQVLNVASDGLFNALTQPADATTRVNWATFRALVTNQVDGILASTPGDVSLLVGQATYRYAETLFRTTDTEESAAEMMGRLSGGLRVSSFVPAVASKDQMALTVRARGATFATAPVWQGIDFVVDEITSRANGQIVLSALMLFGVKVLRQDGLKLVDLQIES